MKKTLKILLIFMGSFMVILLGGIGGYNLIMSNQTFYIYDIRFVVPDAGARSYIYTNNGDRYKTQYSTQKYMKSDDENIMEIAVFVSTSNGSSNVNIYSSDMSVADIEYKNNKCYVRYKKAGEVEIITSLGGVRDSFTLSVFDKIPSGFRVYDLSYYGENYAKRENYANNLVCYSDENTALEYYYGYELFDEAGNVDNEFFNSGRLEIDENSLADGYFDEVSLDTANKRLKIVCKQQNLAQSTHTSIAVKSYYMLDGKKYLDDIFEIGVYIIANEIEFFQVELSTNPDFTDKIVCLNINDVKYSDNLSNDELISYLTSQRVEEKLNENGEKATYNIYITKKTSEIYMKFRLVYTNGTTLELNKSNLGEYYKFWIDNKQFATDSSRLNLTEDGINYIECEPKGEYFVLNITDDYVSSIGSRKSIIKFQLLGDFSGLSLNSNNNLKLFELKYLNLDNKIDAKKLYSQNADGSYSYSYWDKRTICDNVVYDENGNVVEFLI